MSYSAVIRQFVVEEFLPDVHEIDLTDEFDLIDNGVIDSLGLLKMIAWLESYFSISIDIAEMVPENFRSVKAMNALLDRVKGAPLF